MLRPGLLRAALAVRAGQRSAHAVAGMKSTAEIHEAHFPDVGPPATYDDLPIPFKPYQEEYNRQQGQFNQVLGAMTLFFTLSLAFGLQQNVWDTGAAQPPAAYTKRLPRTEKDSPVY